MKKLLKKFNFATLIFATGGIIAIGYMTTYLFPVTDQAFVVDNMTAISSSVTGHIEQIYVENGQKLKKDDPILLIRPEKYRLEYKGIKAQYEQAQVGLDVIQKRIDVTNADLLAAVDQLNRMKYEYSQKSAKDVVNGVPQIELKTLEYNIKSQQSVILGLQKQIELEKTELKQAKIGIETLAVATDKAAMDVADTIVRAPADGYIQNLYIGTGSSALAHEGLFNFVDTANTYIQANFNETDLANVHAGDEVLIFPRAYLGRKIFHGVIMSDNWSVDRQHIIPLKETQLIFNQNHWINLPQRLPVQIRVTDADSQYQLRPGMSAYVYVRTK
ncbi:MAG: HlyD family secretion protein [Proteobacteria bacterium]|nr:MAG: HlyD family secretion protein [Pseudomonadota bacterium]